MPPPMTTLSGFRMLIAFADRDAEVVADSSRVSIEIGVALGCGLGDHRGGDVAQVVVGFLDQRRVPALVSFAGGAVDDRVAPAQRLHAAVSAATAAGAVGEDDVMAHLRGGLGDADVVAAVDDQPAADAGAEGEHHHASSRR